MRRFLHRKSGRIYLELFRDTSQMFVPEGSTHELLGYTCLTTDDILDGEDFVAYQNELDSSKCYIRPSRMFDEPNRFQYLGEAE